MPPLSLHYHLVLVVNSAPEEGDRRRRDLQLSIHVAFRSTNNRVARRPKRSKQLFKGVEKIDGVVEDDSVHVDEAKARLNQQTKMEDNDDDAPLLPFKSQNLF